LADKDKKVSSFKGSEVFPKGVPIIPFDKEFLEGKVKKS
jgi:hypothetical protein